MTIYLFYYSLTHSIFYYPIIYIRSSLDYFEKGLICTTSRCSQNSSMLDELQCCPWMIDSQVPIDQQVQYICWNMSNVRCWNNSEFTQELGDDAVGLSKVSTANMEHCHVVFGDCVRVQELCFCL